MKNETNTPRGRPALPDGQRRTPVTVKLPPRMVAWLRAQAEPQSRLIEKALIKTYKSIDL